MEKNLKNDFGGYWSKLKKINRKINNACKLEAENYTQGYPLEIVLTEKEVEAALLYRDNIKDFFLDDLKTYVPDDEEHIGLYTLVDSDISMTIDAVTTETLYTEPWNKTERPTKTIILRLFI